MRWLFGFIGIYLLGDALRRFITVKSSVPGVFRRAVVLYACVPQEDLPERGRDRPRNKTWWNRNREILPWAEVAHVTLAFRRKQMMAFFERDILGWKVLFDSDQEARLREVLGQYIPKIEIAKL